MNRLPVLLAILMLLFAAVAARTASAQSEALHIAPGQPAAQTSAPPQASDSLTLQDAEKMALQNHPRVQAAGYLATAAQARVGEAKSAYYPLVFGSVTGAYSENTSRIGAGALNNPTVFDRFAYGLTISQLVTDFGRTHELVKSSKYAAQSAQANVTLSRADVLLAVDQAFYGVLRAQAVLQVAQETVKARQLVSDQITTLEKNKLKSGLDVSFANVDLSQAQLLQIQAQNDLDASLADLSAALGYSEQHAFTLADPLPGNPQPPQADFPSVLQTAIQNRPELIGQRFELQSEQSYAKAERDLWFPTLSAIGTAGLIPFRQENLIPSAPYRLRLQPQHPHLQRPSLRLVAFRSRGARQCPTAIRSRPPESHRSRRAHRLAQRQFRVPASLRHRAIPRASPPSL